MWPIRRLGGDRRVEQHDRHRAEDHRRNYTVQFLNGWDATLANINERVFPKRSDGDFAVCLPGADVALPANVKRIDLPVKQSHVLLRVELGDNLDEAVRLQQQFRFRATGSPNAPEIPKTLMFDLEKLPGVEAFDFATAALDSEPDLNAGMERYAANARAIGEAIKDSATRERIAKIVQSRAYGDFAKFGPPIGHGTIVNGWAHPAVVGNYNIDHIARMLITYGGIWANGMPEVLYYRASTDGAGARLTGDNAYSLMLT